MSKLYVARDSRAAMRILDGEAMIMSGHDSTLFSLNRTATVIWQAADGKTSLEEIVQQKVCQEFDVEPAGALRDAEELARSLADHGILRLSDVPIEPGASVAQNLPNPAANQIANRGANQ